MIRSLFVCLVISLLVIPTPGTAAGQTATPATRSLPACTMTPRTPEELHALLGDDYVLPPGIPLAVQATPGGEWQFGIDAIPDGIPADSAELEAVVQDAEVCFNAGDVLRYLAFFTDEEILETRSLSGFGMAMATPELRTPVPQDRGGQMITEGLFHARLLPDGRMAAVASPGSLGLPVLYLFTREHERWLIDDRLILGSPYASSGEDRSTFTGAHYTSAGPYDLMSYGWGLEFGPEWTPVVDPDYGTDPTTAALTNGVSFVLAGVPYAAPDGDLAACVQPRPKELISSFREAGLKDFASALKHGLTPVVVTDDSPPPGADEQRAVAVYDLAASADEQVVMGGPLRLYVECRTMAGGAWVLGVTHLVPAADYETEAAKRDELLATLEDWNPARAPAN